jgi:hypothetical protein
MRNWILLEPILPRGFPLRGITLKIPCLLPISTQDNASLSLKNQIKYADVFALTILSCSRGCILSVLVRYRRYAVEKTFLMVSVLMNKG